MNEFIIVEKSIAGVFCHDILGPSW